jgi:hypothetical protein
MADMPESPGLSLSSALCFNVHHAYMHDAGMLQIDERRQIHLVRCLDWATATRIMYFSVLFCVVCLYICDDLINQAHHHSSHLPSHRIGLPLHAMSCQTPLTTQHVHHTCICRHHGNLQTSPSSHCCFHKTNTLHYVGVAVPFECDMLYGASTFFALQILQAKLRTLPSACTTSGANSMPNICWMA